MRRYCFTPRSQVVLMSGYHNTGSAIIEVDSLRQHSACLSTQVIEAGSLSQHSACLSTQVIEDDSLSRHSGCLSTHMIEADSLSQQTEYTEEELLRLYVLLDQSIFKMFLSST